MLRLCCLYACLFAGNLSAQLPDQFSDQVLATNFDFPVGITFAADGRGYVWEKSGRVWVVDAEGQRSDEPLVDIREEVGHWRDHGLLGFALDPEFAANGYYYLLYAVDHHHLLHFGTPAYDPNRTDEFAPSIGRVTRYTADAATDFATTVPGSRLVLLGRDRRSGFIFTHEGHSVGDLVFGTDGTLLVSAGDGSSYLGPDAGGTGAGNYNDQAIAEGILLPEEDVGQYRAQLLSFPNGKILRIDPATGAGLPSNPYYDPAQPRAAQSRVWARGFRNPYRFTVKPGTGSHYPAAGDPGTLYVGDVGAGRWEELDVVHRPGQNFGWPLREGLYEHVDFGWRPALPDVMAPNPLFGQNGCDQRYFDFRHTFRQHQRPEDADFPNPCDSTQLIPAPLRSIETWPILSWSNVQGNPPARAEVGRLNAEGQRERYRTDAPNPLLSSPPFAGNSSLAGFFYEGEHLPEPYRGKYFHYDYNGWIKVLEMDAADRPVSIADFHTGAEEILHLAAHPVNGMLYYLNLSGELHRIAYGGNPPPVVVIRADTLYGTSPLTVQFDATASYAPLGHPLSFSWDFGNGHTATGSATSHTFSDNGNEPTAFPVTLIATDTTGTSAEGRTAVHLRNTPPTIEWRGFADGDRYPTDRTTILALAADVTDAEHAAGDLAYTWRTFVHHKDHFHREPADTQVLSSLIVSPLGCADEAFWYRIELTVTDPLGLSSTRTARIWPRCGPADGFVADLTATATERAVQLDWVYQTAPDSLAARLVQRSTDGMRWTTLDQATTFSSTETYLDTDPSVGDNQYRIKWRTPDGRYDYSPVATARYPRRAALGIYPNPVRRQVTVYAKEAAGQPVRFEVYTTDGKLLLQREWPGGTAAEFEATTRVPELTTGLYAYRLYAGGREQSGVLYVE